RVSVGVAAAVGVSVEVTVTVTVTVTVFVEVGGGVLVGVGVSVGVLIVVGVIVGGFVGVLVGVAVAVGVNPVFITSPVSGVANGPPGQEPSWLTVTETASSVPLTYPGGASVSCTRYPPSGKPSKHVIPSTSVVCVTLLGLSVANWPLTGPVIVNRAP